MPPPSICRDALGIVAGFLHSDADRCNFLRVWRGFDVQRTRWIQAALDREREAWEAERQQRRTCWPVYIEEYDTFTVAPFPHFDEIVERFQDAGRPGHDALVASKRIADVLDRGWHVDIMTLDNACIGLCLLTADPRLPLRYTRDHGQRSWAIAIPAAIDALDRAAIPHPSEHYAWSSDRLLARIRRVLSVLNGR